MADSLEDLELKQIPLSVVLDKLDEEFYKQEFENTQRLQTYVTALNNIRDQIDLEGLAISSLNESAKWKDEAARLHQLAQLGITVEIIGHEIEGLDMTINSGLKVLEEANLSNRERQAYQDILHSQQSLSDKWRFLSPLKLSGDKTRTQITGQAIYDYVMSYLGDVFTQCGITFKVTDAFKNVSLLEQPARLFPVFINLVNNARYWVRRGDAEQKEIMMDYRDGEVVVADNGPGVDRDDFDQLFTLFFTRKQRGGRGVGLYLCKQNLLAGGHSIRYETNDVKKVLSGANFVISLKGINNGSTSSD
jgi:signal transduction histidine kinase